MERYKKIKENSIVLADGAWLVFSRRCAYLVNGLIYSAPKSQIVVKGDCVFTREGRLVARGREFDAGYWYCISNLGGSKLRYYKARLFGKLHFVHHIVMALHGEDLSECVCRGSRCVVHHKARTRDNWPEYLEIVTRKENLKLGPTLGVF